MDPGFKIVLLTGLSGSGKSTALHALEDQGFLCIDNLPVGLLAELSTVLRSSPGVSRLAVVVDVRAPGLSALDAAMLARLRQNDTDVRLVFLEAREEVLLRRYSETRRPHPLDRGAGLQQSLRDEQRILAPLRELATDIVDTSELSMHALRAQVTRQVAGTTLGADLRVSFLSFGFKHGIPLDAALVLDVRFLANPYFVSALRPLTGRSEPVRTYVMSQEQTQVFVAKTTDYLAYLVPHFVREGKRYLTVAIGCTGGQHRSVAVAEALCAALCERGIACEVRHRDIDANEAHKVV
jgi:UPF0042 nucleotide-binding protein